MLKQHCNILGVISHIYLLTLFKIECLSLHQSNNIYEIWDFKTSDQLTVCLSLRPFRPDTAPVSPEDPWKCHTVMASVKKWCADIYTSISSLVLYAVSVWADMSDRKPSRGRSAITITCLDESSRATPEVVVSREGAIFFALLPLWNHCIIQKTLTEPCSSLYIFGTKLDLPTSHKKKNKKKRKNKKNTETLEARF